VGFFLLFMRLTKNTLVLHAFLHSFISFLVDIVCFSYMPLAYLRVLLITYPRTFPHYTLS